MERAESAHAALRHGPQTPQTPETPDAADAARRFIEDRVALHAQRWRPDNLSEVVMAYIVMANGAMAYVVMP